MKLLWEYELSDEVMVNKSKNNYYSELLSWVCQSVNYFRNLYERRWLNFWKCILLTVIYYSNYITMSFEYVTYAIILHGWNCIQTSDWLTEQYTSILVSLGIFIYIQTVYYDLW